MLVRLVRSVLPLLLALACLWSVPAGAQEPAPATPPAADAPAAAPAAGGDKPLSDKELKIQELKNESVLHYYYRSLGVLYTVIFLALSFTLTALVILNGLALRKQAILPDALAQNFEAALNEKNYQGAYEMAKSDESFLGAVLAAGMSKLQSGYDAAEEAMNEAGSDESMKLEHRLSYVALIGSLAPMLGLLGTVDGMVASFEVIAKSSTSPSPAELAKGIQTALITTLVGLVMAIPAIGFFAYFKNTLARFIFDVGSVAEGLMSRFKTVKK